MDRGVKPQKNAGRERPPPPPPRCMAAVLLHPRGASRFPPQTIRTSPRTSSPPPPCPADPPPRHRCARRSAVHFESPAPCCSPPSTTRRPTPPPSTDPPPRPTPPVVAAGPPTDLRPTLSTGASGVPVRSYPRSRGQPPWASRALQRFEPPLMERWRPGWEPRFPVGRSAEVCSRAAVQFRALAALRQPPKPGAAERGDCQPRALRLESAVPF